MSLAISKLSSVARRGVHKFQSSNAMQQGVWLLGGMVISQVIRLGGNLILTRLLFPEAFGLVALVTAIAMGVSMLSDVGIRSTVIKSKRSDDPLFMRTVWTMQVLRGVLLSVVLIIVAWPLANLYDQPLLKIVLPIWTINILFTSGKSVALYLYDKKLDLKRQIVVDASTQLFGVAVMVIWAYFSPSVWALVVGSLISSFSSMVSSYVLFDGHHFRFAWDKSSVKELFTFGRWILLSSALGYIANQGDKLIMGKWLTMEDLGVYSIAAVFASVVSMIAGPISSRLLQPLYRQHLDDNNYQSIYKIRIRLNMAYAAGCILLAWSGDLIIRVLYDDRYVAAGWMLQLLALRSIGYCANTTLTPFLLSSGDSFSQMKFQMVSTSILIVGMLAGAQVGVFGLVLAYSLSSVISHAYMAYLARAHNFYCIKVDVTILFSVLALSVAGWILFDAPVMGEIDKVLNVVLPGLTQPGVSAQ